ncbi:MAG TPA: Co2+/Mg2+ efflux protein ApaG [Rhizomicrobium sp.]|nr:Co2+/Mg2+ efflux protein ApaG [Rhizomicrobium sp.]
MRGLSSGASGEARFPIYQSVTRGIRVTVKPSYLEDQSDPEEGRFLWSYHVTIENNGGDTVQLLSRHWQITDAHGRVKEVRGPGVVGAQPILEPGQSFKYTSGCPLETPSGAMNGHYDMRDSLGSGFAVEIPLFLLESPHERRQIH